MNIQPKPPLRIGLGLGFALLLHAFAWTTYVALGWSGDHPAIPTWAVLALFFGGREWVLAAFALPATFAMVAGMHEHAEDNRPRLARLVGVLAAIVAAGYAYRWFEGAHPGLGTVSLLNMMVGLLGPAEPRRERSD
jgi:hypothetical protein